MKTNKTTSFSAPRRFSAVAVLLLAAGSFAVACGSKSSDAPAGPPDPGEDAAPPTKAAATTTPPKTTTDAAVALPPLDAGGWLTDAATDAFDFDGGILLDGSWPAFDGGDSTLMSLFPAAQGRSWTMQIYADDAACNGVHTATILSAGVSGTKNIYTMSSFCDGYGPQTLAMDGQSLSVDVGGGLYEPQLAAPVTEGAMFAGVEGTAQWHLEGQVTVPAGTFQGCWRVTTSIGYSTYCPGVGTVHRHEQTAQAGVLDAVLLSKNF